MHISVRRVQTDSIIYMFRAEKIVISGTQVLFFTTIDSLSPHRILYFDVVDSIRGAANLLIKKVHYCTSLLFIMKTIN